MLSLLVLTGMLMAACTSDTRSPDVGGPAGTGGHGSSPRIPKVAAGEVEGPLRGGTHGFPQTAAVLDLKSAGYQEDEFLLRGTARAYSPDGPWGIDGRWAVHPTQSAPYVTRLLVRRPRDARKFNGIVVVEWFNVTSKVDIDVDFGYLGQELLRRGYGWVGVSAQAAGVTSNGGSAFGASALGLKAWDPKRYAALEHPGDAYSYDIFSQAGAAVRTSARRLFGGSKVQDVIADGESQSAFRMLTYVNAVQRVANVYDGFLIHSRAGTGAPLGDDPTEAVPAPARVRTDLDAPVFQVLTETDMFALVPGKPGWDFPSSRQPDSSTVHTWEIAGTAHADGTYLRLLLEQGRRQFGTFLDLTNVIPIANNGPQGEVMRAALHALRAWVVHGTRPAIADPIRVANGAIVRDADGNALGGVRTPAVDVPVSTLSGEGAQLIGSTKPFDPAKVALRYPNHRAYVAAVTRSANAAAKRGFLLPEDVEAIVDAARNSTVGG